MKKRNFQFIMLLAMSMLLSAFYSCSDDGGGGGGGGGGSSKTPKVKTYACDYDETNSEAYLYGQIIDDYDMEIENFGFCWSTSGTPTVNDHVIFSYEFYEEDYFYGFMSNLNPNTTYYVRAFAENEKGIGYGEKKSFKTTSGSGNGQWYYYDNGQFVDAIGYTGGSFYWGVMFPAGSFTSGSITKVAAFDYESMNGTVSIYTGGSTAPGTLQGSKSVSFTGTNGFKEFEFSSPIYVGSSSNVWVVFYKSSGDTYPASCCENTGNANGRWISTDGSSWFDLLEADLGYTFMIRAYITSNGKCEEMPNAVNNNEFDNYVMNRDNHSIKGLFQAAINKR